MRLIIIGTNDKRNEMKQIKFYIRSLCVITLLTMFSAVISCTNELWDSNDLQEFRMKLNIGLQDFDGTVTRASSTSFEDGAALLIRFDNNVYGTAVYDKSIGDWNVSLKGSLSNYASGTCTLYYSPNKKPTSTYTLTLSHLTPLYSANGIYHNTESGPSINATLKPAIPRVCFKGTSGKKISLSGLSYYKSIDASKSDALSTGSSEISLTVNGMSTDYVYGFFAGSNRELTLTVDGVSYTRTIESSMLNNGQSGYIDIPTASNSGKWKGTTIKSITLNKSSVEMVIGETLQLSTTITPTTAVNKTLKWTSSSSCIEVNSTGLLTAKSKGQATVTATATDGSNIKATCTVTVNNAAVLITNIEMSETAAQLPYGESLYLTATVTPSNASNKSLEWSSDNGDILVSSTGEVTVKSNYKQGTAIITSKAKDGSGMTASCTVNYMASYNGHGYVDLGLPSGTKWAITNIGAKYPEDTGDYFAWGETQPKSTYLDSNYKFYNTTTKKYSKYIISSTYGVVDNKTVLERNDDAAYVNWGSLWYMPTIIDINELIDNCNITSISINGVHCEKFTSKKNNQYIIIPPSGFCESHITNPNIIYFWSATLDDRYGRGAYYYCLGQTGNYRSRYYGHPVRPVRK